MLKYTHFLTTYEVNKCFQQTNTLEYGNNKKIFKLLTWWGIKWYPVFVYRGYYSQVIAPIIILCKFSYKTCTSIYNALYWKVWFVGFLQIESHIAQSFRFLPYYWSDNLSDHTSLWSDWQKSYLAWQMSYMTDCCDGLCVMSLIW